MSTNNGENVEDTHSDGGDITSTIEKYLHYNSPKSTLKLTGVEVVETPSMFIVIGICGWRIWEASKTGSSPLY
jgi:hypothetical protein